MLSSAPQLKNIDSLALSLLYGLPLTSLHNYWKNHSFDMRTFVGKVMSLLFNMLSVCHSFSSKEQASFNYMAAVILESKKIKSVTIPTFPPYICHEVMGLDAMILVFIFILFYYFFLSPADSNMQQGLTPSLLLLLLSHFSHVRLCVTP